MRAPNLQISGKLPDSYGLSALTGERDLTASEFQKAENAFDDIENVINSINSTTRKGLDTLPFSDIRITAYEGSGNIIAQDRTLYAPDGLPYGNHPYFPAPYTDLRQVHVAFDMAAEWNFGLEVPRAIDGSFFAVTLYHEILHSSTRINEISDVTYSQILQQYPYIIEDLSLRTNKNTITCSMFLRLAIEHDIIYGMDSKFAGLLEKYIPKYKGASKQSNDLNNFDVVRHLQASFGASAFTDEDASEIENKYILNRHSGWDDIDLLISTRSRPGMVIYRPLSVTINEKDLDRIILNVLGRNNISDNSTDEITDTVLADLFTEIQDELTVDDRGVPILRKISKGDLSGVVNIEELYRFFYKEFGIFR